MATMTLEDLVTQLRAAYGSRLSSVVLYGSAAGGDHIQNRSDYNVLVLVDSVAASELAAASAVARAWHEAGNPPPMTMTAEEWKRSSDIFPMEYADILERHRMLFGDPPFDGIAVEPRDLRLQLEQEAMGKLIKLRQGVLASGNDRERQLELLAASLNTFMIIFRSFLRLHGTKPPTDNVALAEATARQAGFDAAPFVRVVQHVRGKEKLKAEDAGAVLAAYLRGTEQLVSYLDTHQPTT